MSGWRRTLWRNPAGWYVTLGTGLLAFSLWVPWLSASRTARVEERAEGVTNTLLEAAAPFVRPLDDAALDAILARFFALAEARGVWVKDIERVEPPPVGTLLCLRSKHYAFQLAPSPHDVKDTPGRDTVPALEVVGWPLSVVGPGHCAFFRAENAERAFTRNLRKGYAGFDEADRPKPGAAQRRPGLGSRRQSQYPGNDGERWILY